MRVPRTRIGEGAMLSVLPPDGSERLEAAIGRRLDRLSRQSDRLEHHVAISNEAMALFVRFWLTTTPPLPDTALPAAQASGRERYRGFVESPGRRMETGASLARELTADLQATPEPHTENLNRKSGV